MYLTEGPKEVLKRCGEMPSMHDLQLQLYDRKQISDLVWSPDCRFIAWSIQQIGMMSVRTISSYEGVYIYNDRTKEIKRIYAPTKKEEDGVFARWLDKNTAVFSNGQQLFNYNVYTEEMSILSR